MDSMGNNKIAAAVLTAGIAFWGLGLVADNTVHPKRLEKSAIEVKGGEAPAAGAAVAAAEPAIPPIAALLVKANPADGEALTKKVCIACHNFQQGGGNKVGPALYGVVGRQQASAPGYTYSSALGGHHAKWTYAELNKWLIKPAAYAPGTKMAYAGISNDQTRADVIDYLRTLAATPEPLPTAAEAAAEAAKDAKPAAAAAPAASAAQAEPPLEPLLAKASVADGQALTKKVCIACHNFNEGGANKVGPALYGVVGRKQASADGYTYSTALKGHTGVWSYGELNKWLTKPSAYAPGTKMAYAGITNPQTRADVIDYLHTLSASPLPLPSAEHASVVVPAAPAAAKPATKAEPAAAAMPAALAAVKPASKAEPAAAAMPAAPAAVKPASKAAPAAAAMPAAPAAANPATKAEPAAAAMPAAVRPATAPADAKSGDVMPKAPAPSTQAATPDAPKAPAAAPASSDPAKPN